MAALPACAATSEDGIFEPGFNAPASVDGAGSTEDDGGSSDDSGTTDAGKSSESGDDGDESEGEVSTSDGVAQDTCPDALLDTGYTCHILDR